MNDPIPEVLLADDDRSFRESIRFSLKKKFHISEANTVENAKSMLRQKEYDVAIVDLCFEAQGLDGVDLMDFLLKESPKTPIVILSGDDVTQRIVNAAKRSHVEFVVKREKFFPRLEAAIARALRLRALNKATNPSFLTKSPLVMKTLSTVDQILRASSVAPILIYGETGTGKEHLAKYIAEANKQRVVAANMASIPQETAESHLFGHERGAFTGAHANHVGLIEQANNGIFFLDEVGECSPSLQAKLLRVIQEKEVQPLGSTRIRSVSVRFVAATHRNLQTMAQEGEFREDLYQRLSTFIVSIPSLRDRPEDILFYTEMFLNEVANGRSFSIDPGGLDALLGYSWPGNTRELKRVIQRIATFATKSAIDSDLVRWALYPYSAQTRVSPVIYAGSRREALIQALRKANGNRAEAARVLGIDTRAIFRWIERFGLSEYVAGKPGRPAKSFKVGVRT